LLVGGRKADGGAGNHFARAVFHGRANHRVKHRPHIREMLGQKRAGKFDREKPMLLVGRTAGGQRIPLAMVEAHGVGGEFHAALPAFHKTAAIEI
jgi:hypothetical protein